MQGITDVAALGLDEGVAHAAADDEVVHLAHQVLEDGQLGAHLGAADDGGKGPLCVLEHIVDGLDFAFHEVAEHLVVREVSGDEGGGAVGAVSRAESVVDVAVCIGSQGLDELLLGGLHGSLGGLLLFVGSILGQAAGLAFFLGIVAEVLQQQGFAGLEGGGLCLCLHAVIGKLDGNAQAFAHAAYDVLEGELGIHLLGTAQVGHDDEGAAGGEHLLEGGHGPADAGVVRNLEICVEGDVEIDSHDGFLAGEVVLVDELLHRYMDFIVVPTYKVNYLCRKFKKHGGRISFSSMERL